MKDGRNREIDEIIKYRRTAEVGQLLLGEAPDGMKPIFRDEMRQWPRRKIRDEREIARGLRPEIRHFISENFPNMQPSHKLSELYEPLYYNGSIRMPLRDFEKFVGGTREGLFRGAPLHSTVHISGWGLQTEFPEDHLYKDLAVTYNELLAIQEEVAEARRPRISDMKYTHVRRQFADTLRREQARKRMCLLACFNLIEAYVNGLAWEYAVTHDTSSLSNTDKDMLLKAKGSIVKRLIRIPEVVSGEGSLLHEAKPPLSTFIETIKPYRDSIVHASPFAAPEKFGGYDKLERIYELEFSTVKEAVEITEQIINHLHRGSGGDGEFPPWYAGRSENGEFLYNDN